MMHEQSSCFATLNLMYCFFAVLVSVAVVVASGLYSHDMIKLKSKLFDSGPTCQHAVRNPQKHLLLSLLRMGSSLEEVDHKHYTDIKVELFVIQ